jgi:hypothetical protein
LPTVELPDAASKEKLGTSIPVKPEVDLLANAVRGAVRRVDEA